MKIRILKLAEAAVTPTRKNPTDAGLDLYANGDYIVKPHTNKIIHTGISVEVPEGYMFLLKPKGRSNHLVGAGVVDAYYHPGEIMVKVFNVLDDDLVIRHGEAVAQGVFIPIETPEIEETAELKSESARSAEGGIVKQATFLAEITDVD